MAVNAAGLPILFQTSSAQLQDLISGFTPGETLGGRVVEVLPSNQALVNLGGQNVVAQVPAGLSLAKGDVLSLQVSQAEAGSTQTAASLVLKLLAVRTPGAAGAADAAGAAGSGDAGGAPSASASLEQALSGAKLPATALNLSLARTLAALGAPLDPETLAALSNAAESLLAAERGAAGQAGEDPSAALAQGLAQVKLALSLNPSAQDAASLSQAGRALQTALDALGAGATASSASLDAVSAAVGQVLAEPGAAGVAALQAALDGLGSPDGAAQPASGSGAAGTAPPSGEGLDLGTASALSGAREALAQWLGPLNGTGGKLSAGSLAQGSAALAAELGDSEGAAAGRLLASVQAQVPGADAGAALAAGRQALGRVSSYYASLDPGQEAAGTQAVRGALNALGLPAPQADLGTFSPASVGQAVAWLGARGLPAQRPLVESVTAWLSQGQSALPAARQALQAGSALSGDTLAGGLGQAYADLEAALNQAGVDPSAGGLDAALGGLASSQGLDLEHSLAASQGAAGEASAAADRSGTVRGALARLEDQLSGAAQGPGGSDQAALGEALKAVQNAARAYSAVPLQAQSAPAFDTVHLPLPVWMNGALGDGRLSVTWRQGRARELDDKEPVTVAVSLDTEQLGPVTVHLKVWKGEAAASVLARDADTARFLATGADDLRQGFSRDTPFALRSVDFSVAGEGAPAAPAFPGAEARRSGLSLSA